MTRRKPAGILADYTDEETHGLDIAAVRRELDALEYHIDLAAAAHCEQLRAALATRRKKLFRATRSLVQRGLEGKP